MNFIETKLSGAFIIETNRLTDHRGYFARTFCQREFEKHGLVSKVAQANMSLSEKKGTFRGMHYQIAPYQETKLVQCTRGGIFDVIIDLRKDSPTYKQWIGVELTPANGRMLFVPRDFAHGFITLEDDTSVSYLVSEFYTPNSERGIKWDDPQFGLMLPTEITVISEKDNSHPTYQD